MSSGKPARCVDRAVQRQLDRQRTAVGHKAVEVVARDIFHREVLCTPWTLAGVERGDDIGVVEPRRDLHLAPKPLHRVRVAAERRRQNFQGDNVAGRTVKGHENDPHSPLPELVHDEIATDHQPLGFPLGDRGGLVIGQLPRPDQGTGQA